MLLNVPIQERNRRTSISIALLIAIVAVTTGGGITITLLLMSSDANAETKAGIVILFVTQVIKMLYDSFKESQLEIKRARMEAQVNHVSTQVATVTEHVTTVADQVTTIGEKSDEAITTSRTGLAALVKSDDLLRLDELADGFAQGTLTEEETTEFVTLLELRKKDDLTPAQLTAVCRMLEIAHKELANPKIRSKPHVPQTPEAAARSKEIQAAEEIRQKHAGTRKQDTKNAVAGQAASPATPLTLPGVVAAAKAAAVSAKETKEATEEVVILAAKEIEKAREKK